MILYSVYLLLSILLTPLLPLLAIYRLFLGKEDPKRVLERFGVYVDKQRVLGEEENKEKTLWIHAASVGESKIALHLIEKMLLDLRYSQYKFLITTYTRTSADLVKTSLPNKTDHRYITYDSPVFILSFLAQFNPKIGIFIESEIWPNLVSVSSMFCSLVMVNARISDKSFKKWSTYSNMFSYLVNKNFKLVLTQSKCDLDKYKHLNALNVSNVGNLKYLYIHQKNLHKVSPLVTKPDRFVIFAYSTHYPDEQHILESYVVLKERMKMKNV